LSGPAESSRSAGVSGRAFAILVALAAALIPALFLAPHTLAANGSEGGFADQHNLIKAVNQAFVEYWNSGRRDLTPEMDRVVDYWFRFHLAKAAIAAILLIVLVALGVLLWKAFLRGGGLGAGRRAALASAGVLVTILAVFSLVIMTANVQGAVAPFTSVLTLLPVGARHGRIGDTLDQVRQRLADYKNTGHRTPPPLEMMISDNTRYHAVLAVMTAILMVAFIGLSVMLWKRFAGTDSADRRERRVLGSYGALAPLFSLLMIVLAVANVTNATDPVQGLIGFFGGGHFS
jgi:hypothetical protein